MANNNNNNWESLLTQQEKQVYSDYFKKVDADNKGIVLQDEAMIFFQKSDVPSNILKQLWDASDNDKKGFLTEQEFCTVLKFIACAQHEVMPSDPSILATSVALPQFNGNGHSGMTQPQQQTGAAPPLPTNRPLGGGNAGSDLVTQEERAKYISLFQSFGAENNILSGEKARDAFMRSNLPPELLQRVWSLADTRLSGSLNQTEFIIAMHYIERCMKGQGPLPPSLPPTVYASATGRNLHASPLVRHNTLATPTPATGGGGISRHPTMVSSPVFKGASMPTGGQQQTNVAEISIEEYNKYKVFFEQLNVNNSGFISGADAVVFFKHSKLDDSDLARIWDIADTSSTGQLSVQEFALAMCLINRRVTGGDIPASTPQVRIGGAQQHKQQQQQEHQPIADLLGLSSDVASTAIPTSPQQQQQQQQQPSNFSNNNTELNSIQSNIQQENTRHQNVQSQYHVEAQAVQELERQIASQKETLVKIKQEAEEAEKQLAAEKEKKESLTKELQMYRQEIKHFSKRAENAQTETQQVKKDIEDLEKEKNQKTTATVSSPVIPFHNASSSPIQHDNVFTLSSVSPNSGLFAKVVEEEERSKTTSPPQTMSPSMSSQKAYDPFAGFKVHQTKINSPTFSANSLNHLKEESEKKKTATSSPTVDIGDIESKFPDLNTMEQNFAMPTSPTLSTTSQQKKTISSPGSVKKDKPSSPFAAAATHDSPFTPSFGKDNIFGIYEKSKTTNDPLFSEKPSTTTSSVSKYGFDLSAFEPSTSTTGTMSVKDELSSLFGGSQAEDITKPTPSFSDAFSTTSSSAKPANDGFDDIFGAPATTNKSNSFEDIFFQK